MLFSEADIEEGRAHRAGVLSSVLSMLSVYSAQAPPSGKAWPPPVCVSKERSEMTFRSIRVKTTTEDFGGNEEGWAKCGCGVAGTIDWPTPSLPSLQLRVTQFQLIRWRQGVPGGLLKGFCSTDKTTDTGRDELLFFLIPHLCLKHKRMPITIAFCYYEIDKHQEEKLTD